jgi:sugar phosphate isomerase/epimerase
MKREALGANCLAGLFLEGRSVVDAHCAALDCLAATGFAATEISSPGLLSIDEAPSVRQHAERVGLSIRAVHAPPMRRDPMLARQRAAAELAAELGASILVVHVSSIRFASPDPAVRASARERDLQRLDSLIQFCSPRGLALGLENGYRPGHPEYLVSLLAALEGPSTVRNPASAASPLTLSPPHPLTPSSPVGLVFDSGHAALRGGDAVKVARTMLSRLIHTHLHDNHGALDEHLVPGQGLIDWPALLSELLQGGYAGTCLLELAPRDGRRRERWAHELALGHAILSQA